ncbi:MAG: hypothetical protein ACOVQE_08930 [Chitinophagaceae bacterium]
MNKAFFWYSFKFLLFFAVLYSALQFYIGITVPGGWYFPFFAKYLNIIEWYRDFMFFVAQKILGLLNFQTETNRYTLRIVGSNYIRMVWSCLGIGVQSFWFALVLANAGKWAFKLKWLITGFVIVTACNISRIVVIIIANNKKWLQHWKIDHHDAYNIFVYGIIFLLIFVYKNALLKQEVAVKKVKQQVNA